MTARGYRALAAQAVTPFSGTSQPFEGVNVDRRETAGRPGGEVTRVRRGRVAVAPAVDTGTNSVGFVGPNGVPRTVVAQNPDVQSFIRRLRPATRWTWSTKKRWRMCVEPLRSGSG